jgi:hypothetical protein
LSGVEEAAVAARSFATTKAVTSTILERTLTVYKAEIQSVSCHPERRGRFAMRSSHVVEGPLSPSLTYSESC